MSPEQGREMQKDPDHYSTLGIDENASQDAIKARFHALAKQHHPDSGGSEVRFKRLSAAYDILKDPGKRAMYDDARLFGTPSEDGGGGEKDGGDQHDDDECGHQPLDATRVKAAQEGERRHAGLAAQERAGDDES